MSKQEQQNTDNQLIEWRKKFNKEIPERVGLTFYTNEKCETEVEVYFVDDNMWMSQQIMSNLFDVEEHTISYHIAEIFKSGELEENSTTRKIRVVRTEGTRQVNREIQFYNLDMVISVGYRVNSVKATQFRKFATRILHEYIQKQRIKQKFTLIIQNGIQFLRNRKKMAILLEGK